MVLTNGLTATCDLWEEIFWHSSPGVDTLDSSNASPAFLRILAAIGSTDLPKSFTGHGHANCACVADRYRRNVLRRCHQYVQSIFATNALLYLNCPEHIALGRADGKGHQSVDGKPTLEAQDPEVCDQKRYLTIPLEAPRM